MRHYEKNIFDKKGCLRVYIVGNENSDITDHVVLATGKETKECEEEVRPSGANRRL